MKETPEKFLTLLLHENTVRGRLSVDQEGCSLDIEAISFVVTLDFPDLRPAIQVALLLIAHQLTVFYSGLQNGLASAFRGI